MRHRLNPPLPSLLHANSVDLRINATDAESRLWYHLRAGRLAGLKFRRQHPLVPYIADFYCHEALLVVELDGSQHGETVDASRQQTLERRGLQVLRFWNNDIFENMAAVLEAILDAARSRTLSPTPLPTGEGLTSEKFT